MGPETGLGKPRRVEQAVAASVAAATLDAKDAGAAALAVELARAVDVASMRNDPYGIAQAATPLREQLIRLKLDPASRGDTANDFAAWLDGLDDHPEKPHPAHP